MATTNGYELTAIQDNANTVLESLGREREGLTRNVSVPDTDSTKSERLPLTKAVVSNGVQDGSNGVKSERYPLSNCVASNGPRPAHV